MSLPWFTADKPRTQPLMCGLVFYCLLFVPLLLPAHFVCAEGATLNKVSGSVMVRSKDATLWNQVSKGYALRPGDAVKTRRRSETTLGFDDGSKVEVGAKSFFVLQSAEKKSKSITFTFGRMKAWVNKAMAQRFTVRTPTAVCSVRGTLFSLDVAQSGKTSVSLFNGLVGVADNKGNEVLLKPGQSVDVDTQGLGSTRSTDESGGGQDDKLRTEIKKEVGLEMTKEEVQAAAALEMKSAVYQDGKALVDVNGNRVRVESYIIRSSPNQFKLVVLNSRVDRFDYFYYKGLFNTTLPTELSEAFRQLNGCIGAACQWYLTERERAFSNTQDYQLIREWGGHLVDLNSNADATDNVTKAVDYRSGEFVDVTGAFHKTLFDYGNVSYNGTSHSSWEPAGGITPWNGTAGTGIQNLNGHVNNNPASMTTATNITNIKTTNCSSADECTGFRNEEKYHYIIYAENGSGSVWDKAETYLINDQGDIVDRAGFPTGDNNLFKQRLLEVNYQQIITASEFGGRKIDLVVTPRILIDSGLIP